MASSLPGVLVTFAVAVFAHGASVLVGPRARPPGWGKTRPALSGVTASADVRTGRGDSGLAPILRKLLQIAHIKVRRGFVVCFKYIYFFHSPHDVCFTGRLSANGRKKKNLSASNTSLSPVTFPTSAAKNNHF